MASDRFHIIKGGNLPNPGTCWVCGASHKDCVFWGRKEWEGAVLICLDDLAEAATLLPVVEDTEKTVALQKVAAMNMIVETLKHDTTVALDNFSRSLAASRGDAGGPIVDEAAPKVPDIAASGTTDTGIKFFG